LPVVFCQAWEPVLNMLYETLSQLFPPMLTRTGYQSRLE
jgi:hypothetical protein